VVGTLSALLLVERSAREVDLLRDPMRDLHGAAELGGLIV
jgi:hypothetical protein